MIYESVELQDGESVCVDALVHTSMSLIFASGVMYVENGHLCWPVKYTDRLLCGLMALHTYEHAPFTARRLVHKIEAVMSSA